MRQVQGRAIEIDTTVGVMADRAASLRRQAEAVHPLLGQAFRRRAAELELTAWATAARGGRPVAGPRQPVAA